MPGRHPVFSPETIRAGLEHLQVRDPILARVIQQVGPFTLKRERDRFTMLVRSIISQQISTAAARSIRLRLEKLVHPGRISPETLGRLTPETLRTAGLSPQKLSYIQDLCEKSQSGVLRLDRIARHDDEAVIEHLIQVKGIGRWTAQMFLLFCLGRLDVFPHDDLGVRTAIKRLYGLAELPDKKASHALAEPWRPYASIASWYCWRSGDLLKAEAARADATKFPV